jgi:hypothetical protein
VTDQVRRQLPRQLFIEEDAHRPSLLQPRRRQMISQMISRAAVGCIAC